MNKKVICALAGGLIISTAGATSAMAEGSWSSTISHASIGFESRVWTDKNTDANGTIVRLYYCQVSSNYNNVTIKLMRAQFGPDENRGYASYSNCAGSTGQQYNWGDQPGGDYHFTITTIGKSSTSTLNSSVKTYY